MLALFVLLEVGLRLFWSNPNAEESLQKITGMCLEMEGHPTRLWAMTPGVCKSAGVTIEHDENGLRRWVDSGMPLRLMTLGDSSIYGHGLSDGQTIHEQLKTEINDRGISVDAIGGGIPGYSSEQTLVMMDDFGWELNPDLLIVASLWSDNSWEYFQDREWMQAVNVPFLHLDKMLRPIATWSWLKHLGLGNENALQEEQGINRVGWIKEPNTTALRRVPLQQYAENIDRLMVEAAKRDIGCVVLQLSNRQEHTSSGTMPWQNYKDAQDKVATRRGVPIAKMQEALADSEFEANLLFQDLMHPTATANKLIAGLLADTMGDAGWPKNRLIPDPEPPPFNEILSDSSTPRKVIRDH